MATPFTTPPKDLKSWNVFLSIRKGECRCVLIWGQTMDEAWKTLQLDPGDVVMAVYERSLQHASHPGGPSDCVP